MQHAARRDVQLIERRRRELALEAFDFREQLANDGDDLFSRHRLAQHDARAELAQPRIVDVVRAGERRHARTRTNATNRFQQMNALRFGTKTKVSEHDREELRRNQRLGRVGHQIITIQATAAANSERAVHFSHRVRSVNGGCEVAIAPVV